MVDSRFDDAVTMDDMELDYVDDLEEENEPEGAHGRQNHGGTALRGGPQV